MSWDTIPLTSGIHAHSKGDDVAPTSQWEAATVTSQKSKEGGSAMGCTVSPKNLMESYLWDLICDLIWRQGLCRPSSQMRSSGWALIQHDLVRKD